LGVASKLRICYLLKLESGGMWGAGKAVLEANIATTICKHPKGYEIPCIPSTYIKGVLRRSAEEIITHLVRVNIVGEANIVEKVFGPLTPFEGVAKPIPVNTFFGPLYPVRDVDTAKRLAGGGEFMYLADSDSLAMPSMYVEPHVRLDDRCGRASLGALFKELRVSPETLFYGEILYVADNEKELVDAARLLTIAVARLNYRYVGRRTAAKSQILCVEPSNAAKDEVVEYVLKVHGL